MTQQCSAGNQSDDALPHELAHGRLPMVVQRGKIFRTMQNGRA
jgi:hypothetical protein